MAILALALSPLLRPIRDDWVLDGEVLGIAMDWRDFGEQKAQERLDWALSKRNLQHSIRNTDCVFETGASGERTVKCLWTTEVVWPVLEWKLPMTFGSAAAIDVDGDLYTP